MRRLKRKARLVAALAVAVVFSMRHPSESWGRITGSLAMWWEWVRYREKTPFWTYYGRMRACYHCQIFYRPLRTCGSPLTKDLRGMGCYCNMESAASIPEKDCWLRETLENDDTCGWPDHLRPSEGDDGAADGDSTDTTT